MRPFAAAIALVAATLWPVNALALNTWGTDMSDLWFNSSESGWGANLTHQQEIIFMTLFVYGPDNRVRWYVADALRSQGGANQFTFSGALYETNGPFYGGAFNSAAVGARQVGSATLNLLVRSGTLTYSVDGVNVTKAIERQTFRANNLSGDYIGGAVFTDTGCSPSGNFESLALYSVSHSGSQVSIVATLNNGPTCTYAGTYTQEGRMGRIDNGSLSCSNGLRASFNAFEIEASYQGFFTRYNANYGGGCTEAGRIGGLKR